MLKDAAYLLVHLAAIGSMCTENYLRNKSLYHMMVGLVDRKIEHFVFCTFLAHLVYLSTKAALGVFIGFMSPLEVEIIQENGFKYLGNMCLIVTMYADDVDLKKLVLFAVVLGMKVLHWALGIRIDTLDKTGERRSFGWLCSMCALLAAIDCALAVRVLHSAIRAPGISILFGLELFLLLAYSVKCMYALGVLNFDRTGSVETRVFLMFYGDFCFGVLKIVAYIWCMFWTTVHFRMPLSLLRETAISIKLLVSKTTSVLAYRDLLRELDRCPTMGRDELDPNDRTCLICHEEMESAKKLDCAHIFHLACLKEWLHRQQACPVCRKEVKPKKTERGEGRVQSSESAPESRGGGVYFRHGTSEYDGIPVSVVEEPN